MNNYKHTILLLLRSIIFICSGFVFTFSRAQSNVSDTILKHFNEYQQNNLQEKLFIHTDRDSYIAGETVWFKIYYVNAADNQLLNLSKVAYAEILDKNQQPVLQAKISLQKGMGNGFLSLPTSLPPGNYIFRAYTNWMKNFDADFYFQKTLTVINTFNNKTPDTVKSVKRFDIQFFPEGGDLVNGIQSKVAFRMTDESGTGVDFNGAIISEANDTVVRFRPAKFGIGSFIFTPEKDKLYKAVIKPANESRIIQHLPPVHDNGFVMTVSDPGKEKLKISIKTNTNDPSVCLFIHAQQHINIADFVAIKNGAAEIEVDKNKLEEGISHITLFNSASQPVCERLYFKNVQKKLLINAAADAVQYTTRKKVTIDILSKDEAGKPMPANMSMAVFLTDSIPLLNEDIFSYLWLSSDLKGRVESPEYYFKDTSAETKEALDNLMLTHGWRRFTWADVLANKKPALTFLPEYEGHIVSGRLINTASGNSEENIVAFLSVPGTHFQLYTSKSNNEGLVYFNTKDLYGSKLIVAQANGQENSRYRIDFTSPFSENYSSYKTPSFSSSATAATNSLQQSISAQVQNMYARDTGTYSLPARIDTAHFYGKPDVRYLLEDYTRFPTMEEVLREYVREINVRKRRDNYNLTMVVKDETGNADVKNPIVFLDGVPQFDNGNKITHYSALKVKALDIILDKYYLGPATFDGIASFTTYKGDLESFQLDTAATIMDYDALELKREFYSPVYQTRDELESRLPDFRNTLYWAPDIQTDKNGKQQVSFYTSDQRGKYAVVLQGLSASGRAGSEVFMIEVKKGSKSVLNDQR